MQHTLRRLAALSSKHDLSSLPIVLSQEVRQALHEKQPIIAFESTIATHGLPREQALLVPLELEDIARRNRVVPCTFGLLNGIIYAGINATQLQELVECQRAVKLSRRDLGPALLHKLHGSTTVAATSFLSHLVGIKVFATGGIGGVHRGGEHSLDISADLLELSRTPTAVVCAGAKSILDIGRTLEFLETYSVTVSTFGPSLEFPAFYSSKSGYQSPWKVENATKAAKLMKANEGLGNQSGILFAVPIPDSEESRATSIQWAVEKAVDDLKAHPDVKGKAATPWLLGRVKELSKGSSVESNIALIKNNTEVACAIAKAYHSPETSFMPNLPNSHIASDNGRPEDVLIIGSAAVDIISIPDPQDGWNNDEDLASQISGTTVPGQISLNFGGVARNLAEAAQRLLQGGVKLACSFGDDSFGASLSRNLSNLSIPFLNLKGAIATPICNSLHSTDGALITGVADMHAMEQIDLSELRKVILESSARLIAFDGNLSVDAMRTILETAQSKEVPVFFEPTSKVKSKRLLRALPISDDCGMPQPLPTLHITPNRYELSGMYDAMKEDLALRHLTTKLYDEPVNQAMEHFKLPYKYRDIILNLLCVGEVVPTIWLKLGKEGLMLSTYCEPDLGRKIAKDRSNTAVALELGGGCRLLYYHPALPIDTAAIKSDRGAGDSFLGALLSILAHMPAQQDWVPKLKDIVKVAQEVACLSLESGAAINPRLTDYRSDLIKRRK